MDCNKTNCMECKFGGQSDGCHFDENSYNQAIEDLGNALCDDLDNGYVFMNKHQILHYVKKLKR